MKVHKYKYELDLLKAFFLKMIKINPDYTIGHNIFGFDDKYINSRVNIYKLVDPEIEILERM